MKFRAIHINRDGYYALGVDEENGTFVLEVIITWVAWYSRYFRLTNEEFDGYPENQIEIDRLALTCVGASGIENNRNRFISSQKVEENI